MMDALTTERMVQGFLDRCEFTGKSPDTLKWYRNKLRVYREAMGSDPEAVTPQRIVAFISSRPCTDEGKAGFWRVIRAFHRWAAEEYQVNDPTRKLKPRFRASMPRPIMPRPKVEAVLSHIRAGNCEFRARRDYLYYRALYLTGCRLSEMLNIQRDHLDLESRQLVVIGKGNKTRIVPLVLNLADDFREWLSLIPTQYVFTHAPEKDSPLSRDEMSRLWRDYQKQMGMERTWRVHDLRHACATRLYEAGMDLSDLQGLLGHSVIAMTQKYARFSVKRLKDRMDALLGDKG